MNGIRILSLLVKNSMQLQRFFSHVQYKRSRYVDVERFLSSVILFDDDIDESMMVSEFISSMEEQVFSRATSSLLCKYVALVVAVVVLMTTLFMGVKLVGFVVVAAVLVVPASTAILVGITNADKKTLFLCCSKSTCPKRYPPTIEPTMIPNRIVNPISRCVPKLLPGRDNISSTHTVTKSSIASMIRISNNDTVLHLRRVVVSSLSYL